jgi:excisionase family DNA binding protein
MTRRRAAARRVKKHLSYTAEEAADALGVHRHTVRRWVASKALPALTEQRPHLILGRDLQAFLTAPTPGRARLKPGELYCVKCRLPKRPALGMADYMPINERIGNLRAICPDCGILMHRRVALDKLDAVAGDLEVIRQPAEQHLRKRSRPSTNVDFGET